MPGPNPPSVPHVALLVETSRSYGREILRGVGRYLSEHGPWSVYLETRAVDSQGPPWLRGWRGDGVLTRTGNPALAALVRAVNAPVVELRRQWLMSDVPFVGIDNRELGQRVADHLLDRGFRRFGVYALDTEAFFVERTQTFLDAVRRAGCPCEVRVAPRHRERPAHWERHQDELAGWVRGLPKPAGVMASNDQLGFWLLDACHRAGVAVPDELAVVGFDDDESLCGMARPPLSSVRLGGERVGYAAAALLDRLMRGEPPPPGPPLFPPLDLVTRGSSDVVAVAVADPALSEAIRFVRERACDGVTVADVLRAVPVSRSGLERGFRAVLGRSPNAELRRVRLTRARQLLRETDLPLAAVAARAGVPRVPYFCKLFKDEFGQTPGSYRASTRR